MSEQQTGRRAFEAGRVMSRITAVLAANGGKFTVLALLLYGAPQLALGFVQLEVLRTGLAGATGSSEMTAYFNTMWFMLASLVVSLVLQILLQAATVHVAVEDLKGRRADVASGLMVTLRNLLPLAVLSLLQFFGVLLGFFLLVVPGVILSLAWSVTVPALIIERTGIFGAFTRSADLTRNHRGAILTIAVTFIIATLLLTALINGVGAAVLRELVPAGNALTWSTMVMDSLLNCITAVVGAVGVAAIYFELRWAQSAPEEHQELAAIFD